MGFQPRSVGILHKEILFKEERSEKAMKCSSCGNAKKCVLCKYLRSFVSSATLKKARGFKYYCINPENETFYLNIHESEVEE